MHAALSLVEAASSPSWMEKTLISILGEWALHTDRYGNPFWQHVASAGLFVAVWGLTWIFKTFAIHRLHEIAKRTAGDFDDFLLEQVAKLRFWFCFSLSLFVSTRHLELPGRLHAALQYFILVTFAVHGVTFLQRLVGYGIEKAYLGRAGADASARSTVKTLQVVARWILWSAGLIFILDNLGFDITAAVAGLGIGGVAVALAAQSILGDLFSAFSIFLDRPFQVGDLVQVGDLRGTVEHIGLKTTRVRSIDGEQLVFANADLTSSRIRNFRQMQERRVIFRIGVTYQTPTEQCRRIPRIVQDVVEAAPGVAFERAHFVSFGDFALLYEIAFRVLSADAVAYLDAQHAILLSLKQRFEIEKIEFAYPTQTLLIAGGGPAPLPPAGPPPRSPPA